MVLVGFEQPVSILECHCNINVLGYYVPGARACFHDVSLVCCKLDGVFLITPDWVSFLFQSCKNAHIEPKKLRLWQVKLILAL